MKDFKNFRIEPVGNYYKILIRGRKNVFSKEWNTLAGIYDTVEDAEAEILNMVIDRNESGPANYTPKFKIGQTVKYKDRDSISGAYRVGKITRIMIKAFNQEPIYSYSINVTEGKMYFNDIDENELTLC